MASEIEIEVETEFEIELPTAAEAKERAQEVVAAMRKKVFDAIDQAKHENKTEVRVGISGSVCDEHVERLEVELRQLGHTVKTELQIYETCPPQYVTAFDIVFPTTDETKDSDEKLYKKLASRIKMEFLSALKRGTNSIRATGQEPDARRALDKLAWELRASPYNYTVTVNADYTGWAFEINA